MTKFCLTKEEATKIAEKVTVGFVLENEDTKFLVKSLMTGEFVLLTDAMMSILGGYEEQVRLTALFVGKGIAEAIDIVYKKLHGEKEQR